MVLPASSQLREQKDLKPGQSEEEIEKNIVEKIGVWLKGSNSPSVD